ncbi:hypothetical protein HWV62_32232 [Athelia sp. TMB]|nr:hypothetical protein HWV62_32232 [Athelia sp. TMB]
MPELQRVEDIVKAVGSTEALQEQDDDREEGSSSMPRSRDRRSAVKARKSMSQLNTRSDTLDATPKLIQAIKLHRRKRHAKLRELTRDEEDGGARAAWAQGNAEAVGCPVCGQSVRGDRDVVEAHVDACVAHEGRRLEEERLARERDILGVEDDVDIDGDSNWNGNVRLRATDGANLRGMGFHTRSHADQDVDDVLDIDGDDEVVFGGAQFTEGDILGPDAPVQIDSESESDSDTSHPPHKTLRELVAAGRVVRRTLLDPSKGDGLEGTDVVKANMEEVLGVGDADRLDGAVDYARKHGDRNALVRALEDKIKQLVRAPFLTWLSDVSFNLVLSRTNGLKCFQESMRVSSTTSLLCRICLDPYTEPTASTGCWHTCCRECWLRCLGSTKLCPICKRITAAADLRRVFL